MSGKLDQSLDQIMKDTGANGRAVPRRTKRRAAHNAKAAMAAPIGGVKKNTKASAKPSKAPAVQEPIRMTSDSKIIISNLPEDVDEKQIKDYIGQTIGNAKKVMLNYAPNGRSRGVANITFGDPISGARAAKQLDGVRVDGRQMKIEVVLGAKQAPAPTAPKTLAERASQPRNAAREAKKTKAKTNGAGAINGAAQGKGGRAKKAGRGGKPQRKSAVELDAEMTDYFGVEGVATNGAAAPAVTNGADNGSVDEVL